MLYLTEGKEVNDQMIGYFKEIFQDRVKIIEEHRKKGKKVIGWVCTYVPEEIIYAAGMLPVRIFGGREDITLGSAYLYTNICSFVRSLLEEALKGEYRLDGFVTSSTCDHIRRLYDVWSHYLPTDYNRILSVPSKISPTSLETFREECLLFKEELEATFHMPISQEALSNAIEVYNKTRSLLKRLYELRKRDLPPISGEETLWVVLASMVMPKDKYNELLEKMLDDLERKIDQGKKRKNEEIRVLIMGSLLDDPEYIRIIESTEGLVVCDDLCSGSRYFWDLVDTAGDPIKNLAYRYLTRAPCPRMFPPKRRLEHLRAMVERFHVEGIIYECIKFCDLHGGSYPLIKDEFEATGIPVLHLEREYTLAGIGQMKTRVQAFFESIRR
jgi:benzoyl-CoA reductase subunit C